MIPSVTEILKPFYSFKGVSEERLALAGARGTRIHKAIWSILNDVPYTIEPEDEGYVRSFEEFAVMIEDVYALERRFVSEEHGFSGQPDFVGVLKYKGTCVIDWKTPVQEGPAWACQIEAYRFLAKVPFGGALRLDPRGGIPKMTWYESNPGALRAFCAALTCRQFFGEVA